MELKIEKGIFKKFELEEITSALQVGLSKNFESVTAKIIDCPNLRDWNCPSEGMSGNQRIIDVGGESTRPGSNAVNIKLEWSRINKILKTLLKKVLEILSYLYQLQQDLQEMEKNMEEIISLYLMKNLLNLINLECGQWNLTIHGIGEKKINI